MLFGYETMVSRNYEESGYTSEQAKPGPKPLNTVQSSIKHPFKRARVMAQAHQTVPSELHRTSIRRSGMNPLERATRPLSTI